MIGSPETKPKARKVPYRKPEAVKYLESLADAEARRLHPTCPHLAPRKYKDHTSNGLKTCIIDFLRLKGQQAERISVTGRWLDQSTIVTNVLGSQKRIGSRKWIPASMQKGSADLSCTIWGRSVKIEIKIGSDKQSEEQKRYEEQVIRAGGLYWLVKSFDQFLNFYCELK